MGYTPQIFFFMGRTKINHGILPRTQTHRAASAFATARSGCSREDLDAAAARAVTPETTQSENLAKKAWSCWIPSMGNMDCWIIKLSGKDDFCLLLVILIFYIVGIWIVGSSVDHLGWIISLCLMSFVDYFMMIGIYCWNIWEIFKLFDVLVSQDPLQKKCLVWLENRVLWVVLFRVGEDFDFIWFYNYDLGRCVRDRRRRYICVSENRVYPQMASWSGK